MPRFDQKAVVARYRQQKHESRNGSLEQHGA
jgi:hypothetical protein